MVLATALATTPSRHKKKKKNMDVEEEDEDDEEEGGEEEKERKIKKRGKGGEIDSPRRSFAQGTAQLPPGHRAISFTHHHFSDIFNFHLPPGGPSVHQLQAIL